MNRKLIIYGGIFTTLIILTLTNPKKEEHREVVKDHLKNLKGVTSRSNVKQRSNIIEKPLENISNPMIQSNIEDAVSRNNYVFFSETLLNYDTEKEVIGLGILGNVFLNRKFKERFRNDSLTTANESNEEISKVRDKNHTLGDKSKPNFEDTEYDWSGEYSAVDTEGDYTLRINTPGPTRWAEYEFQLEAVGIQLSYKIRGYANRNDNGEIKFYFLEVEEGAFYQESEMDRNKPMFSMSRKGDRYHVSQGNWNVTDFFGVMRKKP
jgi:hypothetical protein